MIVQIHQSYLSLEDSVPIYIREYIQYIVDLLYQFLCEKKDICIHIAFGDVNHQIDSSTIPTIHIKYNIEHTLVKEGSRDIPNNTIFGSIPVIDDSQRKYLIRIHNLQSYYHSDLILDYSIPNIKNIQSNLLYSELFSKLEYISPMLYSNYKFEKEERDINIMTSYININEPRRKELFNNFEKNKISYHNVNQIFDKYELQKILSRTKIIVNVHQTEDHHTFEELRCLPALLCGTLVVSEYSPLSDYIPYKDYIIWTFYENIIPTVLDVMENYNSYHQKIFHSQSKEFFDNLHQKNIDMIHQKIDESMYSLEFLSKKYILDKSISTNNHNYIPGYKKLFDSIRDDVKNMFEIGIGSLENNQMGGIHGPLASLGYKTGNSLRCWRDYFSYATIYGMDIFHHHIEENRIKVFQGDQSSSNDLLRIVEQCQIPFDIIIDDGSHLEEHQIFSFMFLEKYLSKKGIYVIEDIQPSSIERFQNLSNFPLSFQLYIKENYDIIYFDTRSTINRSDDFMMAFIRKSTNQV